MPSVRRSPRSEGHFRRTAGVSKSIRGSAGLVGHFPFALSPVTTKLPRKRFTSRSAEIARSPQAVSAIRRQPQGCPAVIPKPWRGNRLNDRNRNPPIRAPAKRPRLRKVPEVPSDHSRGKATAYQADDDPNDQLCQGWHLICPNRLHFCFQPDKAADGFASTVFGAAPSLPLAPGP